MVGFTIGSRGEVLQTEKRVMMMIHLKLQAVKNFRLTRFGHTTTCTKVQHASP
jgi:hypothetical protein